MLILREPTGLVPQNPSRSPSLEGVAHAPVPLPLVLPQRDVLGPGAAPELDPAHQVVQVGRRVAEDGVPLGGVARADEVPRGGGVAEHQPAGNGMGWRATAVVGL